MIPARATAKISTRLVPHQTTAEAAEQLKAAGYTVIDSGADLAMPDHATLVVASALDEPLARALCSYARREGAPSWAFA